MGSAIAWISILLCVFTTNALPPNVIKSSGKRIAEAIQSDLGQAIKLLDSLHAKATKGQFHDSATGKTYGFPELHRQIELEMEKIYSSDLGGGGTYASYFAEENGSMNGVLFPDNRYHVWVGHPPSNPALDCLDPKQRVTCTSPSGTTPGYLETYEIDEDSEHYQLGPLFQNVTFDPRKLDWYQPSAESQYRMSRPYVAKPDSYTSSMGVTLSRAVRRNGDIIGVVGVDIDLSSIDMIIGPLRPAVGSEVVLIDPFDGTVLVSTFAASRKVRWTHKKVSCFEQPFLQIFDHVINTVGRLSKTISAGPFLLHAHESKILKWNSIYSLPISVGDGKHWLLVLTDDSENRGESGSAAQPMFFLIISGVLAMLLSIV